MVQKCMEKSKTMVPTKEPTEGTFLRYQTAFHKMEKKRVFLSGINEQEGVEMRFEIAAL